MNRQTIAAAVRTRRVQVSIGATVAVLVLLLVWGTRSGASKSAAPATASSANTADSVVTLDTTALRLAGVEIAPVAAFAGDTLIANGTITFDANRVAVVAPRAEGRIITVRADLGHVVRAGATLAILESPDVGQTRGDLERARAAVSVSRRNYEREKRLYEQEISPQKEMLDAEVLYRTAEADLRSASAKLSTYGAMSGSGGSYGLQSAVSGTVVERNATPGQIVGPSTPLFTVADLSHVWITVDVFEADLQRIHQGAAVAITTPTYPGERFSGRVSFAGGVVDSVSRTLKVRVVVENVGQRLRPGMYAQAHIVAPSGRAVAGVTVPSDAVQELNGRTIVFVVLPAATGGTRLVARRVVVAPESGGSQGGRAVIVEGLRAGEQVAVKGAFQLKSELTKASFAGED